MQIQIKVQQKFLDLINQIFEIEKKTSQLQEPNTIGRNVNKLKEIIESEFLHFGSNLQSIGFIYHNPIGEPYNETRTDCDASVSGTGVDNLKIIEVIKPIIHLKQSDFSQLVQKAVVIVQSETNS